MVVEGVADASHQSIVEGVYDISAALCTARRLGGERKYIACEPSSKTFAGLEEGKPDTIPTATCIEVLKSS